MIYTGKVCVAMNDAEVVETVETQADLILHRLRNGMFTVGIMWDDEQSFIAQLMQAFNVSEDDFGPAQAHGIGRVHIAVRRAND